MRDNKRYLKTGLYRLEREHGLDLVFKIQDKTRKMLLVCDFYIEQFIDEDDCREVKEYRLMLLRRWNRINDTFVRLGSDM